MGSRQFYRNLLDEADNPKTKLIYLTPEKFVQSTEFIEVLTELYKK